MPAPVTANEFLELVRRSRVLDERRLSEFVPDESELPSDPKRCAAILVKAGALTSFQAKQLLQGRYLGLLVGTYRLLEPIGQGGMGVVYKAEHVGLKRLAAVKILPPEKARDKTTLDRFLREARSAAALDHPNIVKLFDVGQSAGVHYLALEFVDGQTLDRLVESTGPVPFQTAVHYIVQAAAGLSHAHERGFVHRDVKPGNLILARDGTIKILDMGLARSLDREEDRLTEQLDSTTILGTVDFIAPEQALNVPTDERADIYSLGATLYALLTGRPPFAGNATQKLMQHQVREADRLCDIRPEIPVDLSDVVDLMMTKRPEDRVPTAADAIRALAPWLPSVAHALAFEGIAPTSGAITAPRTADRTKRSLPVPVVPAPGIATRKPFRKWLVSGFIAVFVILIALGLGSWYLNRPEAKQPANSKPQTPTRPIPPRTPPALQPLRLEGWDEPIEHLAVSADGRLLATAGSRGTVGVWNLTDRKLVTQLDHKAQSICHTAFDSNGKRLVTASRDGTIRAWELPGGKCTWTTPFTNFECHSVIFTPDSLSVLVVYAGKVDCRIAVIDALSGRELSSHAIPTCKSNVVFTDDDLAILATSNPRAVILWDYRKGMINRQIRLSDAVGEPRALDISLDRTTLAVGGGTWTSESLGFLTVLNIKTGVESTRLNVSERLNALNSVSFSPTGRHIAASGQGKRVRVWEVETGRQIETLDHPHQSQQLNSSRFALNGRIIVSGDPDGVILVWPLRAPIFKYTPLPLGPVATASSQDQILTQNPPETGKPGSEGRILMPDWAPRQIGEVPFTLIPPREGSKNVIALRGQHGRVAPQLPVTVTLPTHAPVAAIHLLGSTGAWAWPSKGIESKPNGSLGSVAVTVRLHFADGTAEDHPLRHGIEYADWVLKDDLPEAKIAIELAGPNKRYLRHVIVRSSRPNTLIKAIQLIKSADDPTTPVFVAVTLESP